MCSRNETALLRFVWMFNTLRKIPSHSSFFCKDCLTDPYGNTVCFTDANGNATVWGTYC